MQNSNLPIKRLDVEDILAELEKPLETHVNESWFSEKEAISAFLWWEFSKKTKEVLEITEPEKHILSNIPIKINEAEIIEITSMLDATLKCYNPFSEAILFHSNLFHKFDGENILMYLGKRWHVDAFEELLKYPFDLEDTDKEWRTLYVILEQLIMNEWDHFDKVKWKMCLDFVNDKLYIKPTLKYIIHNLEKSKDIHMYYKLINKIKQSWDINEKDEKLRTLLHLSVCFWDLYLTKLLLNAWMDIFQIDQDGMSVIDVVNNFEDNKYRELQAAIIRHNLWLVSANTLIESKSSIDNAWRNIANVFNCLRYMKESSQSSDDFKSLYKLITEKRDINMNYIWHKNLLQLSAFEWDAKLISRLIYLWVDPFTVCVKGYSAKDYAIEAMNANPWKPSYKEAVDYLELYENILTKK